MPMASETLSPASAHNSRSSSKWPAMFTLTPAGAAQHGAGRDSHRGAVSVVVGQRVGDLARSLPTEVRRADVAVGGPCAGAHVPAVRGSVLASGLQVLGDQRGILVGRFRAA